MALTSLNAYTQWNFRVITTANISSDKTLNAPAVAGGSDQATYQILGSLVNDPTVNYVTKQWRVIDDAVTEMTNLIQNLGNARFARAFAKVTMGTAVASPPPGLYASRNPAKVGYAMYAQPSIK